MNIFSKQQFLFCSRLWDFQEWLESKPTEGMNILYTGEICNLHKKSEICSCNVQMYKKEQYSKYAIFKISNIQNMQYSK